MSKILIDRAVVERALDTLTNCTSEYGHWCTRCASEVDPEAKVASALRAAFEQPQVEQEPVSKSDNYLNGYCTGRTDLLKELQIEQEPVAWAEEIIEYLHAYYDTEMIKELDSGDALIRLDDAIAAVEEVAQRYTHPQPPRQPLTREAIDAIIKSNFVSINDQNLYDAIYLCMRDVESAHDIEEQK